MSTAYFFSSCPTAQKEYFIVFVRLEINGYIVHIHVRKFLHLFPMLLKQNRSENSHTQNKSR